MFYVVPPSLKSNICLCISVNSFFVLGETEIPFEIPLKPKPGQTCYETYHGVFVNIQVLCECRTTHAERDRETDINQGDWEWLKGEGEGEEKSGDPDKELHSLSFSWSMCLWFCDFSTSSSAIWSEVHSQKTSQNPSNLLLKQTEGQKLEKR